MLNLAFISIFKYVSGFSWKIHFLVLDGALRCSLSDGFLKAFILFPIYTSSIPLSIALPYFTIRTSLAIENTHTCTNTHIHSYVLCVFAISLKPLLAGVFLVWFSLVCVHEINITLASCASCVPFPAIVCVCFLFVHFDFHFKNPSQVRLILTLSLVAYNIIA